MNSARMSACAGRLQHRSITRARTEVLRQDQRGEVDDVAHDGDGGPAGEDGDDDDQQRVNAELAGDGLLKLPSHEAALREAETLLRAASTSCSEHAAVGATQLARSPSSLHARCRQVAMRVASARRGAQARIRPPARRGDDRRRCSQRRTHLTAYALPDCAICASAPAMKPLRDALPSSGGGGEPASSSASTRNARPHMAAKRRAEETRVRRNGATCGMLTYKVDVSSLSGQRHKRRDAKQRGGCAALRQRTRRRSGHDPRDSARSGALRS